MALGTGRIGIQRYVQILSERVDAKKRVNIRNTNQVFVQDKQITDFGYPQFVNESGAGVLDARVSLYSQNTTPLEYTLLFGVSNLAEYTDQYDIFSGYKDEVANSFADLDALAISNLFNNGFSASYTGIDGVALFSNAHPYQSYPTWSNIPATTLTMSAVNLESCVQSLRNTKTARSRPMRFRDGLCVQVPTALEFQTRRIVSAIGQAGTMNLNERNEIGNRVMDVDVDEDLSSTTAFFLRPTDVSKHGLYYLTQMPFTVLVTPGTYDVFTRTMYVSCSKSFATGWTHAQGIFGSAGA